MAELATVNQPAFQYIAGVLRDVRLLTLLKPLQDWTLSRAEPPSEAELMNWLYQQKPFQDRFPSIFAALEEGQNPPAPEEVIAYEDSVRETLTHYGLRWLTHPIKIQETATKLINAGVSADEFEARVVGGFGRVVESGPAVRQAFRNYFGASGDAALAAYFLDPERTTDELLREAETAQMGGAGLQLGINVGEDTAELMARNNIDYQSALQGMARLAGNAALFEENADEINQFGQASNAYRNNDLTIEQHGVEATFGLTEDAIEAVESRRRTRVNRLSGGGGADVTKEGVVGIGNAD